MSMGNPRDRQFRMWADAVDAVSRSNSFTNDQVINTWPDDVKRHYPELTVGAVRYADHCVKNHERLVEALRNALARMEADLEKIEDEWGACRSLETLERDGQLTKEIVEARALLVQLEAEKGG